VVLTSDSSMEINRVINGLAYAMADGNVPGSPSHTLMLRLEGIQAGVKYRGQFEERLKAILDESTGIGDVIFYFHSLADLVDFEDNAKGSFFRPALQAGVIRIITGATPGEMAYSRKVNAGLVACFRQIPVQPLDRHGVGRGLYALRDRYCAYHGVTCADEVLEAIVDTADPGDETEFWQRALDMLDALGARLRQEGRTEASVDDVDRMAKIMMA